MNRSRWLWYPSCCSLGNARVAQKGGNFVLVLQIHPTTATGTLFWRAPWRAWHHSRPWQKRSLGGAWRTTRYFVPFHRTNPNLGSWWWWLCSLLVVFYYFQKPLEVPAILTTQSASHGRVAKPCIIRFGHGIVGSCSCCISITLLFLWILMWGGDDVVRLAVSSRRGPTFASPTNCWQDRTLRRAGGWWPGSRTPQWWRFSIELWYSSTWLCFLFCICINQQEGGPLLSWFVLSLVTTDQFANFPVSKRKMILFVRPKLTWLGATKRAYHRPSYF